MKRTIAEGNPAGFRVHTYRGKVFGSRNHLEDTVSDYRDGIGCVGKSPFFGRANQTTGTGPMMNFGPNKSFTTAVVYPGEGMP